MVRVRQLLAVCMLVVMLFSGLSVSGNPVVQAQDESASGSGFVSGPWRVMALQTVVGAEIPDAGLGTAETGVWVMVVADVTNTGVAGTFDPATLQAGTTSGSLLEMTNGVAADPASSVSASQTLQLQGVSPEGAFPVAENGTIRMAVVFQFPEAPADGDTIVLRLNDQVMSVSDIVVDAFTIAELPALVPEMQLQVADITSATGGGKIEVALRSGGNATIQMDGVVSPEADANVRSSCYAGESATQVMNLTAGTVWIEEVPGSDESLVWFNDPAAANFGLLNAHLIAGGFAGYDGDESPYGSWFGAIEEYTKGQGAGLWDLCKDAEGTWISQPLPTPVPTQSPEQVRAQYQWVDTRDLVIRPGEFEGDKIAVAGTVFNIQVDGNFTAMQIWLDGGSEAAVIYYEGDSRGIYEGTWVTVYGTGAGTFEGTNAFGGTISQPVVVADIVDY